MDVIDRMQDLDTSLFIEFENSELWGLFFFFFFFLFFGFAEGGGGSQLQIWDNLKTIMIKERQTFLSFIYFKNNNIELYFLKIWSLSLLCKMKKRKKKKSSICLDPAPFFFSISKRKEIDCIRFQSR